VKTITYTLAMLLFLFSCLDAYAGDGEIVVRDVAGRMRRREIVKGDTTYVRSPDGRLLSKKVRKGNKIVVRDVAGRIIEVMELTGDICPW